MTVRRVFFSTQDCHSVTAAACEESFETVLELLACRYTVVLDVPVLVVHAWAGRTPAELLTHRDVLDALGP